MAGWEEVASPVVYYGGKANLWYTFRDWIGGESAFGDRTGDKEAWSSNTDPV